MDSIKIQHIGPDGRVSNTLTAIPLPTFHNHHHKETSYYDPETELVKAKEAITKEKSLPYWRMFRYAGPLEIIMNILGVIFAIVAGIFIPLLYLMIGNLIRSAIYDFRCANSTEKGTLFARRGKEISADMLNSSCIFIPLLFLLHFMLAYSADLQIRKLRDAYFEALLRKDNAWFDTYMERGFARRITQDVTQIRAALGGNISLLTYYISSLICSFILIFILCWQLALILFGLVIPMTQFASVLGCYFSSREMSLDHKKYAKADSLAEIILSNVKIIKVFQGEGNQTGRYLRALRRTGDFWRWILLSATTLAFIFFMIYASFDLIFWMGTPLIQDVCSSTKNESNLEVEEVESSWHLTVKVTRGPEFLFVIIFILLFVLDKLNLIPWIYLRMREAQRRADDVFFLIDWKARIDNLSGDGETPPMRSHAIGKIQFLNASLKFPLNPTLSILEDITMTIYPGQIVGIVGGAGSGKSALIGLIQRIYDPCKGKIHLDGRNIADYNVSWLRSQIGRISEDSVIFNTTVEENIRFGRLDSSSEDIFEAAHKANGHLDILALHRGYQTICGEQGEKIPEKLRKKIRLARVFLRMPPIVIFDDIYEEEEIHHLASALEKFRPHSTILIAARRFNPLVKSCDYIYVIEGGKIVEDGNHEDLIQANGTYFKMIEGLVDIVVEKRPIFQSQLQTFKFAQAIERMHSRRDEEVEEGDGSSIRDSGTSVDEVSYLSLLGDIHRGKSIWARFIGLIRNIYKEHTDAYNPRHMERLMEWRANKLLKERDIWRIKRNLQKSKRSVIENKEAPTEGHNEAKEPSIGILRNTAMRNLYGWSQNSTEDDISIQSDDSDAFWNDYFEKFDQSKHRVQRPKSNHIAIFRIILREWWLLIPGLILLAVIGASYPIYAQFMATILMSYLTERDEGLVNEDHLTWTLYKILIMGVSMGLVGFLSRVYWGYFSHKLVYRLRKKLFESILKHDLEWFDFPENDIGLLCARLALDCSFITKIVVAYTIIVQCIISFATALVKAIVITIFTPLLNHTLCLIAFGILLVIATRVNNNLSQADLELRIDHHLEESSNFAYEVMTNYKTIVELGLGEYVLAKYKRLLKAKTWRLRLITIFHSVTFCIVKSAPYLLYAFWAYNGSDAKMRSGFGEREYFWAFLLIGELPIFLIIRLGGILTNLPNSELSREAAQRFLQTLHDGPKKDKMPQNPNLKERSDESDAITSPPRIKFENVSFDYIVTTDKGLLRKLSFVIPSKKFVAVVGHGESGRSALIGLILRLYKAKFGQIKFEEDLDINDINIGEYRKLFALIDLDPGLLESTIKKNIEFGDSSRDVSNEEVMEAAKRAQIHDFIMSLPKGYNSSITALETSPHAFAIKQRISVARAIIRRPKILIVEDAIGSIDEESEALLQGAIMEASKGSTLILSTERIHPIRGADLIIVLEHGSIVEMGRHDQLLEEDGVYRAMLLTQRLAEYTRSTSHASFSHRKASLNYDEYKTSTRTSHSESRRSSSSGSSESDLTNSQMRFFATSRDDLKDEEIPLEENDEVDLDEEEDTDRNTENK